MNTEIADMASERKSDGMSALIEKPKYAAGLRHVTAGRRNHPSYGYSVVYKASSSMADYPPPTHTHNLDEA